MHDKSRASLHVNIVFSVKYPGITVQNCQHVLCEVAFNHKKAGPRSMFEFNSPCCWKCLDFMMLLSQDNKGQNCHCMRYYRLEKYFWFGWLHFILCPELLSMPPTRFWVSQKRHVKPHVQLYFWACKLVLWFTLCELTSGTFMTIGYILESSFIW